MALLRYTLLRVLIFAVVGALLWLFGLRGFVLLLAAVFISGLVSIFVLRGSRDQVSTSLDRRLSTINERLQQRAAAEDAWNDAAAGVDRTQARVEDDGARVEDDGARVEAERDGEEERGR